MDERARPLPDGNSLAPSAREHFVRDRPAGDIAATKKSKSHWRRSIVMFLALVAVAFGLYRLAATAPSQKDQFGGRQMNAPQPVGAATVVTGNIPIVVTALGTVTPLATATVKPEVAGKIVEINFVEGQMIKKGDFLVQIDPRPFQLAEKQYEGQLARDQGLLDQARMDYTRYQTLLKQDSIARQQAEDQAFLIKQYEGAVRTDQAQIDTQKLNQIYAHVLAPISGRIGFRLVDLGNYVQTTDPGLAVITQINPISVILIVAEDDLAAIMAEIHTGQALQVTAYDRANVTSLAVGKVVAIDNQIDTTTGTVKIRAEFDNPDDKLFPNQFVTARLLVKTLRGVAIAPAAAIQHGIPGTYVYVVNPDRTVSVRAVEIGASDEGKVEVKSGLAPGELVVVDGADRLREGARVELGEDKAAVGGSPLDQPKAFPAPPVMERKRQRGAAPTRN